MRSLKGKEMLLERKIERGGERKKEREAEIEKKRGRGRERE